jgi:enediyne biosynthesis protein E4
MALVDLDNDGDMDVAINCANAVPLIYRNDCSAARVAVRLKGQPPNTQGIGATVKLIDGAVKMQSQEMICGGRYLSGDQAMRVFAAGSLTNKMRIEVTWRSGRRTVVNGVQANRLYEIDEPPKPSREMKTASSKDWQ